MPDKVKEGHMSENPNLKIIKMPIFTDREYSFRETKYDYWDAIEMSLFKGEFMLTTVILLGTILILAIFYILVGVFLIPKFAVTSMPEDIKTIIRSRPDYPKWRTALGYVCAVVIALGLLGALIYAGVDAVRNDFSFVQTFVRFLILLMGYKAFDIICLDWWLITKSHFFQKVFPETVGCEGYRQFGFNWKKQIVRIIIFPIISLIVAGIIT